MRFLKKYGWIAPAITLFLCLFSQTAQASEIDLKIPLLDVEYNFWGHAVTGSQILLYGLIVCALGMLFGFYEFCKIKKMPAHKSMLNMASLIYETCKTYMKQQAVLLVILEAFIAVCIFYYFFFLNQTPLPMVMNILLWSVLGILGSFSVAWFGMRMSFYIAAGALFVATIMVIAFVRDVEHEKGEGKVIHIWADLKASLQNKGLLFVMSMFFLVQVCVMIVQPLITMYVSYLLGGVVNDDVVKTAGIIFSLAGIAGIIAGPYWGSRGQKRGYTKTLFMVFICAGAVNMCQFFVHNIWQYAAVTFIYGLFLAGAVPNINARLVEVTDPSVRGKAFGLVTSAQQFGGVVGPLLGGFLGGFLPTRLILVLTGVILVCAGVYTYLTKVRGVPQKA